MSAGDTISDDAVDDDFSGRMESTSAKLANGLTPEEIIERMNGFGQFNSFQKKFHVYSAPDVRKHVEDRMKEKILGDYMSRPLHGRKYNDQRDAIMNLVPTTAAQLMMFGIFAARA
jgi:hypothetical protein